MGQADEPCLTSGLLSRKPPRKFSLDPGAVAFDRGTARKRLANLTIPTRGARHWARNGFPTAVHSARGGKPPPTQKLPSSHERPSRTYGGGSELIAGRRDQNVAGLWQMPGRQQPQRKASLPVNTSISKKRDPGRRLRQLFQLR